MQIMVAAIGWRHQIQPRTQGFREDPLPSRDESTIVGLPHFQAALAVWDYCYAGASLLLGMSTCDLIADRIREAIDAALEKLLSLGALNRSSGFTGGHPSTQWTAGAQQQPEAYEENEGSFVEEQEPAEAE